MHSPRQYSYNDDVINWNHFPRHWGGGGGGGGGGMFSLISAWRNGWVNNCKAADLRRHRAHYGVAVMWCRTPLSTVSSTFLGAFVKPSDKNSCCTHSELFIGPYTLQMLFKDALPYEKLTHSMSQTLISGALTFYTLSIFWTWSICDDMPVLRLQRRFLHHHAKVSPWNLIKMT